MKHLINWLEIPVTDMHRALSFYQTVFNTTLQTMETGGNEYALFPAEDRFNAGALVKGEYYSPAAEGTLIYLDASSGMDAILSKIKMQGGQVLMESTYLGEEAGHVALFIDTEGNRIGLQHN